jgi:hypothetical protein
MPCRVDDRALPGDRLLQAKGFQCISARTQMPLKRLRRYLRLGLQPGQGTRKRCENFLARDVLGIPSTPGAVSRICVVIGLPAPYAEQVTESVGEGVGEVSELHHGVGLASTRKDKRRGGLSVGFTGHGPVIIGDLDGDPDVTPFGTPCFPQVVERIECPGYSVRALNYGSGVHRRVDFFRLGRSISANSLQPSSGQSLATNLRRAPIWAWFEVSPGPVIGFDPLEVVAAAPRPLEDRSLTHATVAEATDSKPSDVGDE